jgi:Protein of unknown function (DUF2971)
MGNQYQFRHISIEEAHARLEAMRTFFEERQRPSNALVYHYTSLAALRGILDSRTMFCTDYRFLNDKTEFNFGLNVVEAMVRARGAESGLTENDLSDILEEICRLRLGRDVTVYCASWALHGNDLSQWRAYAPQDGVSIGFDRQSLSNVAAAQGFSCSPVAYFGGGLLEDWFSDQLDILKCHLEASIHVGVSYAESYEGRKGAEVDDLVQASLRRIRICNWIGQICATIKQPDFSCEQEFRVFYVDVLNGFQKRPKVKTRASVYRALPYIDLGLVSDGLSIDRIVKEVHLGPSNTPQENMRIAEVLMSSVGGSHSINMYDHPLKPR